MVAHQLIARGVIAAHDPFFAPIAAAIALNAPLGERGANALQLLLGVVVGIVAGELAVGVLAGGYGALALATFAAMAVASALGGARIVIAQAAVGAILTVAVTDGAFGGQRLVDALIGAGVALVFSQLLFAPEPVALVRRASVAALADMADGLDMTAQALEHNDDQLAQRAMATLRDLRNHRVAELARMIRASSRVVRYTVLWRSRLEPLVRETANAGHLDLLGGSCVTLTRTVMATDPAARQMLVPCVRALADALADLAAEPGDRRIRQRAADRARDAARRLPEGSATPGGPSDAAAVALRMVIADVMVVAGVDPARAGQVVREGTGQLEVPPPASTLRLPFRSIRWRRDR